MRKILSKEEESKRTRRNQFLIGGILILIMVGSVLGYAFGREQKTESEEIIYNNFEFVKSEGFWNTVSGSYQLSFYYNPKETGNINTVLNPLSAYSNKPLYIYSENNQADMEIYRNLFYQNKIVQRVQYACLDGEKCAENSPLKTCADNFIIIKEGNTTQILQKDNCVIIEGEKGNLTKLSDNFVFKLMGIQ